LLNHGISNLAQLSTWSEKEILALHGIGKSAIPIIKKLLETQQLSFKIEND
jgi:DNA repair protein RadC